MAAEYFGTTTPAAIERFRSEAMAALKYGRSLLQKKDIDGAMACCQHAIACCPEMHVAHLDLGICLHLVGQNKLGWEEYEHRLYYYPELKSYMQQFDPNLKLTHLSQVMNKNIAVFAEQGFGDVIQMMRYLAPLAQEGAVLTVYCPKELKPLINEYHWWIDAIYDFEELDTLVREGTMPPYDYHIPTMSLPMLFDGNYCNDPYIKVKENYNITYICLKVGVVWHGSPKTAQGHNKSCPLECFEKLSEIDNVQLFGMCPVKEKKIDSDIFHLYNGLNNFRDTARLINSLDLVISTDTAVLHLAGAMGKTTWGLLPYNADFRWGLYGNRTPWYPTMKLFRQSTPGDWDDVFKRVTVALQREAKLWQSTRCASSPLSVLPR